MTQASRDPNKIKYVSLVRGRWVYRPYIPKKERHKFAGVDRNGFLTPIKLGIEADPWHRIMATHAKVLEHHANVGERDVLTLRWIVERYEASFEFEQLSKHSRGQSKTTRRILEHHLTVDGVGGTLGDAYAHELSLPNVKQIRDKRLADMQSDGRSGHAMCNREIAFMSSAIQWARHQYDDVKENPFKGLKALTEAKRTRYVTDDEYAVQYAEAQSTSYDYLPVVFELAYLLSCRGSEVCDLKISDTQLTDEEGRAVIKVPRRKGSKTTHIFQTPRLAQAVADALALHESREAKSQFLLPGSKGGQLRKPTVDTAMQRLKRQMESKGLTSLHTYADGQETTVKPLFWALHDLKRKGISDATDARIGGHKTAAMRERYDTKYETFEPPA